MHWCSETYRPFVFNTTQLSLRLPKLIEYTTANLTSFMNVLCYIIDPYMFLLWSLCSNCLMAAASWGVHARICAVSYPAGKNLPLPKMPTSLSWKGECRGCVPTTCTCTCSVQVVTICILHVHVHVECRWSPFVVHLLHFSFQVFDRR